MAKFLTVILFFISCVCYGQKLSTKSRKAQKLYLEAEKAYGLREDEKALDLVNEALTVDSSFFEAHILAADIYRDLDLSILQVESLKQAIEIDESRFPKINYVLGNALLRTGQYADAKNAYERFLSKSVNNKVFVDKASKSIQRCEFAISMIENAVYFDVESLGDAINSEFDEYWPSLTIDCKSLVFTRLSPIGEQKDGIFNQFQEDFYWSNINDGIWEEAKPLKDINTPYNEGAQSISADGKLIFFTACTKADGFGSCDIYFTRKIGDEWLKPQNVGAPVNTASWESQPSISANGEYLYFVSNRKGGKGKMDIWRCRLEGTLSNGMIKWGKAENLGGMINTAGNEMSPFIHSDGKTLYFASDTWQGMGGLDIFFSKLNKDTSWIQAENIGYPINTYKDEQGLIVEALGKNAYYSSNRPGSKGMDLYKFELYPDARPEPVSYVKGKVTDFKEGFPVCANVELIDVKKNELSAKTIWCDEDGEFLMCLPTGNEYAFNVSAPGYLFFSEHFSLRKIREVTDPRILEIKLKRIEIGNSAVLRNIFFKTNSFELLDESIAELGQLKAFLVNNPGVKIEIGGHTDNTGSEGYNLELSEKRAMAVYDYLLENEVGESRLTYKGYGWSVPVDTNETAAGRSKNRRTEFRIVSLN